jgi:DNA end-binding protein Ku
MTTGMIEQIAARKFEPEKHEDQVRIQAAIQERVEGKEITAPPAERPSGAEVVDLMAALKASLGASARGDKPKPPGATRAPKRRAANHRKPDEQLCLRRGQVTR